MEPLIDKNKAAAILQIGIGVSEADFRVYVLEAQKFDLRERLCEDFFYDLLKNKAEENYVKLLNGGDYEYQDREYQSEGLNSVIAYFAYARFYMNSSGVSTTHGIVTKTNPHSQPVSHDEKRNVYYKKRQEANQIFDQDVVKFIERNIEDYPLFKCDQECGSTTSIKSYKSQIIK